ncbi:MAG: hypothetical protein KDA24_26885 [Deltaproteobacteria bacterium]|nr:hypothetical protein [Deltaproteobacteria bacterium]
MSRLRAVTVLEVATAALWDELDAQAHIGSFLGEAPSPTQRVVVDEGGLLQALAGAGISPLARFARRDAAEIAAHREDLTHAIDALRAEVRAVLHSAQRHALEDIVLDLHAWDPRRDAEAVTALHALGMLSRLPDQPGFPGTRYRLDPDLPLPADPPYDFCEAAMDETEDLEEPGPSITALLHDIASLAAAIQRIGPRLTAKSTVTKSDARKLGDQLGDSSLRSAGDLEGHDRWGRALNALRALHAVSTDPIKRELFIDHGLEHSLEGTTEQATDRIVHRLMDRDLHVVLPALRAALKDAGDGAVDEIVFLDLLREQHRDVLFPQWDSPQGPIYPVLPGELMRPFDDEGWERHEERTLRAALKRATSLGLIRRAPGVFAGTPDGRQWAGVTSAAPPPVWVTSDLELMVPPDAVTPWERFQLERLGTCLSRDVVDRYRLQREALRRWLSTHDVEEALELLARRAPGIPDGVVHTLQTWARSESRVSLVRGVLLPQ